MKLLPKFTIEIIKREIMSAVDLTMLGPLPKGMRDELGLVFDQALLALDYAAVVEAAREWTRTEGPGECYQRLWLLRQALDALDKDEP